MLLRKNISEWQDEAMASCYHPIEITMETILSHTVEKRRSFSFTNCLIRNRDGEWHTWFISVRRYVPLPPRGDLEQQT